jgi:penicillin-binding protein 1A
VGLPNAPSFYNPLRHYKRALNRANAILYRMRTLGWITQEQYLAATKETPKVYRTTLTQNVAPYIVDEVQRRFKGRFGDIRTGGYTIYTTIDLALQRQGRRALADQYRAILKHYHEPENNTTLNGALIAVENATGDILALVGGVDYRTSAFNRATMTHRQPGSAFKPFVYQTALDMGYNPATKLTDLARTFRYSANGQPRMWSPRNYERDYKGFITLREALVHSRNLATVNLVYDIGIEPIRKRLALLDVPRIPKDLSIALGNLALSPLKMAQIYTVFSNQGHMIEPRLVSKIVSRQGAVLYETKPKEIADFTRPEQAYLMTDILHDVIKRGTGKRAQAEGIDLAGKTGTTNRGVDAWFCGYSPTITTVVWYGRDTNHPIGTHATGGTIAAPAFADFYRSLLEIYPNTIRHFERPKGVFEGKIDGKKELYTAVSPLPGMQPPQKLEEMFEGVGDASDSDILSGSMEAESLSDSADMEVIQLDETPIIESDPVASDEASAQPPAEEIDPLHLKSKHPKSADRESEGMF